MDSDSNWLKISELIDKARNLYKNNLYLEAIELYKEILNYDELEYKDRAAVFAELGYCFHEIGNHNMAIKTLHRVNEFDASFNDKSGLYRILGGSYFEIEEYQKALRFQKLSFQLSFNLDDKNILIFQMGRSYLFLGDGKNAKDNFLKYLKSIPDSVTEEKLNLMYNLGFAFILLEKYKKAEESFQYIIDHNINNEDIARGYYGLAELYYNTDKFVKVKYFTERILDIYGEFSQRENVLFYRIMAYATEGNLEKVTELIQEFVDEFPNSQHLDDFEQFNI